LKQPKTEKGGVRATTQKNGTSKQKREELSENGSIDSPVVDNSGSNKELGSGSRETVELSEMHGLAHLQATEEEL